MSTWFFVTSSISLLRLSSTPFMSREHASLLKKLSVMPDDKRKIFARAICITTEQAKKDESGAERQ